MLINGVYCIKNSILDTLTYTLYTKDHINLSYNYSLDIPSKLSFCAATDVSANLCIHEPTYVIERFHHCFFHAYLDQFIPMISCIHDAMPSELFTRKIQIGFLEENTTLSSLESEFIDILSIYKPLFLSTNNLPRYINFKTLLFGGNIDYSRCIHNTQYVYNPGDKILYRPQIPIYSDLTIKQFYTIGKSRIESYYNFCEQKEEPIVWIGRRHTRSYSTDLQEEIFKLIYSITGLTVIPTYLEKLELNEQIQLFRAAKCIISPHGSGLSNLIWCKPGTKVIEIFNSHDLRYTCFKRICDLFQLHYTPIFGGIKNNIISDEGEIQMSIHILHKLKEELSSMFPL